MQCAGRGEKVGLFDEGAIYSPDPGVDWQLLVGEESAVPAVLAVLDSDQSGLRSEVFLEVPTTSDIQELHTKPNVTVRWPGRDGTRFRPLRTGGREGGRPAGGAIRHFRGR